MKKGVHSLSYLEQEFSAMRWLAEQGLTPEEIREFRWGLVDETERTVLIKRKFVSYKYNREDGTIFRTEDIREVRVSLKGSGQEQFFLKSKTPSFFWVFTEHWPKGWRKEDAREALFPLSVVENCCRKTQITNSSTLTFIDGCANIEISKLNIHKSKTKELTREAEIVIEASD